MVDLSAHADTQVEQLLDRHGLAWRLYAIAVTDIDWDATLARQIRSEPVQVDLVDRYAEALTAGARIPAVLALDAGARWELLGGIHRAKAHQAAGIDRLPAYTIAGDVDDATAYRLALEHNASHGVELTIADKVRHAEQLVARHGLNRTEAARTVGIGVSALDRARAIAAGTQRATVLGVARPWSGLKASAQARIQWSCHDDATFTEAVRTAANCQLTTPQVEEMAKLITAAGRAGRDAVQAVEDFETEHHPARRDRSDRWKPVGGGHGPAPARLRNGAIQLLDIDPAEVVDRCLPVDRKQTADLAFRAAKHLAAISAALKEAS